MAIRKYLINLFYHDVLLFLIQREEDHCRGQDVRARFVPREHESERIPNQLRVRQAVFTFPLIRHEKAGKEIVFLAPGLEAILCNFSPSGRHQRSHEVLKARVCTLELVQRFNSQFISPAWCCHSLNTTLRHDAQRRPEIQLFRALFGRGC